MSGALSDDNQIAGCYLHGIFDQAKAIDLLAHWCGSHLDNSMDLLDIQEQAIEKLADVCEQHMDLSKLEQTLQQWGNK